MCVRVQKLAHLEIRVVQVKWLPGVNPAFPYHLQSSQQGPMFPSPDSMEALARFTGANLPNANSPYYFAGQVSTANFPSMDSGDSALPWTNDSIAASIFVYFADESQREEVSALVHSFADVASEGFEGRNHRMYWSAFGEPVLPRDSSLYFESEEKFNRLRDIKACVDPDDMFSGVLSIPLPDAMPESCESDGGKGKGRKGEKGMKKSKKEGKTRKGKKAMKGY